MLLASSQDLKIGYVDSLRSYVAAAEIFMFLIKLEPQ